jgi:hypothetical protein
MHVIELDVDVDHSFYCPVTGQLILAPEEYKPSPATAFVLPPEAEDFDAMQPRLRKIWDKVKAASDDKDPQPWQLFEDFCNELEHHSNLVLFSLTSHGMACGPVSSTVHLCIDFAHGSEDFDDDEDE